MQRAPLVLAVLVLAAGCRTTPEEIQRIEVENELLREQVEIIRKNCSYYRELEIEAEDETEPTR
ncbi:MAG: hypothetical protein OEM05_07820 [Myxococcales bacterium]|nr:hypothetical protein [Myxococcales bacterium]